MNISFFVLKYIQKSIGRPNHVTRCAVHNTFRFTCGTARVQDEQRIFRLKRFSGLHVIIGGKNPCFQFIPIDINFIFCNWKIEVVEDQNIFYFSG